MAVVLVTRQRPLKLRRASSYYRLAAKAERMGLYRDADRYRKMADRLVDENRRDRERAAKR